MKLYTIGYGYWGTKHRATALVHTLKTSGVQLLVDIRHSACSSNLQPESNYGPRAWHTRKRGEGGIIELIELAAIDYIWLVELGNPQKNDPAMEILREHLADKDGKWPANRGLKLLQHLIIDDKKVCALMCACADYHSCHREIVAASLKSQLIPELEIVDLIERIKAKAMTD